MNILLLTNHLNPGGITSYLLSLGKGLKKRGHGVWIASRGGKNIDALEKVGIEHIYLNLSTKSEISPKIFFAKKRLLNILKKERMDILHAQTRITRVIAHYISKKIGIPFLSTAHGFYKKRFSHKLWPCWGRKIIAISRAVKEDLIKRFGLSEEKIRVIYNGIDLERDNRKSLDFVDRLGIKDGPVLGVISRLSEVKGHRYLLEAMEELIKDFPSLRLIIIGEGKMEKRIKRWVEEMGLKKNVILIKEKNSLLSFIDIFVLPSLEEGLGIAILEAMAERVPVVATDTGGIPEIIKDGENGILVSPRDKKGLVQAILRLLRDKEFRRGLGEMGRKTVEERFNLKKMVEETEKLYEEIVV